MNSSDLRDDSTTPVRAMIDEATGVFVEDRGNGLRLYCSGRPYRPDDLVPEPLAGGERVRARRFVIDRMIGRYGADTRDWPFAARIFICG